MLLAWQPSLAKYRKVVPSNARFLFLLMCVFCLGSQIFTHQLILSSTKSYSRLDPNGQTLLLEQKSKKVMYTL